MSSHEHEQRGQAVGSCPPPRPCPACITRRRKLAATKEPEPWTCQEGGGEGGRRRRQEGRGGGSWRATGGGGQLAGGIRELGVGQLGCVWNGRRGQRCRAVVGVGEGCGCGATWAAGTRGLQAGATGGRRPGALALLGAAPGRRLLVPASSWTRCCPPEQGAGGGEERGRGGME